MGRLSLYSLVPGGQQLIQSQWHWLGWSSQVGQVGHTCAQSVHPSVLTCPPVQLPTPSTSHLAPPARPREEEDRGKHLPGGPAGGQSCSPLSLVFNRFLEQLGKMLQRLEPASLWEICGAEKKSEGHQEEPAHEELSASLEESGDMALLFWLMAPGHAFAAGIFSAWGRNSVSATQGQA